MASIEMEQLKAGMKMMMEKGFAPTFDGSMDPVHLRSIVQAAQERMQNEPGVGFRPVKFGDMEAEISVPEQAREEAVIVYVHGGGLICGNAFSSRGYASMLAGETKLPVYAFSYRLAPENPFPAAVQDCFEAYKTIEESNRDKPLFLIGESGGAYLSIATAMKARDERIRMPAAMILYSPIIDMSGTIDRKRADNDDFTVTVEGLAMLTGAYCPHEAMRRDRYASPYFDDMHGMPPAFIVWNTTETLSADAEIMAEKLKMQGITCQKKAYPECFHAFATAGRGTPESMEVLQDTVKFIDSHIRISKNTINQEEKE